VRNAAVVIALVLLVAAAPAGAGDGDRRPLMPAGKSLASNPELTEGGDGTPSGWTLYRAPGGMTVEWGDHGIGVGRGVRFSPPKKPAPSLKPAGISRRLTTFTAGETIEVTAWIRLDDFVGTCVVWARCDAADGMQRYEGSFENSGLAGYRLAGSSVWSPVTVRVTPNGKTNAVTVGVLAGGRGVVAVDSIHVRVRGKTPPATGTAPAKKVELGPGLYRAEGRYLVAAMVDKASVRVLIPVPILWRDQIPLDFAAWTEPAGHVASVGLKKTEHGFHYAEVKLRNLPKGQKVRFLWAGNVLVLPHRPTPVPKGVALPIAKVPADVKPWLGSTWCCDTSTPALAAAAAEILEAAKTADAVIPATLTKMKAIYRAAKGRVVNLTATEALTKRGSCTSCANLGAALLRANGIPARIIAGYPTWSGPLQTHYVVEYWLPKGGWRLMESTLCRDDRPGWEQIEVAMVRPEDEAEETAGRRVSAAGGVPWLSLTEYPDQRGKAYGPVRLLGDMPNKKYCDHRAVVVAVFKASDDAWAAAAKSLSSRWREMTKQATRTPDSATRMSPKPGVRESTSLAELRAALE